MKLAESLNASPSSTITLAPGPDGKVDSTVADLLVDSCTPPHGPNLFVVAFDVPLTEKPTGTGILDDAVFIGQVWEQPGDPTTFQMRHPADLWLSDAEPGDSWGAASITFNPGTPISTPVDWFTPYDVPVGSPSGTWDGILKGLIPNRELIDAILTDAGYTWRMDRLGRVLWGLEADVYPSDPVALITDVIATPGDVDDLDILPGQLARHARSARGATVRTYGVGPSGVATSDRRALFGMGSDLFGSALFPNRILDLSAIDDESTRDALTEAAQARFDPDRGPRIPIEFTTPIASPALALRPGDRVSALFPRLRIEDPDGTNVVTIVGDDYRPLDFTVRSMTFDSHQDMGVAFYRPRIGGLPNPDPWEHWSMERHVVLGNGGGTITLDTNPPFTPTSDRGIIQARQTVVAPAPRPGAVAPSQYDADRDGPLVAKATGNDDGRTLTPFALDVGRGGGFQKGLVLGTGGGFQREET